MDNSDVCCDPFVAKANDTFVNSCSRTQSLSQPQSQTVGSSSDPVSSRHVAKPCSLVNDMEYEDCGSEVRLESGAIAPLPWHQECSNNRESSLGDDTCEEDDREEIPAWIRYMPNPPWAKSAMKANQLRAEGNDSCCGVNPPSSSGGEKKNSSMNAKKPKAFKANRDLKATSIRRSTSESPVVGNTHQSRGARVEALRRKLRGNSSVTEAAVLLSYIRSDS